MSPVAADFASAERAFVSAPLDDDFEEPPQPPAASAATTPSDKIATSSRDRLTRSILQLRPEAVLTERGCGRRLIEALEQGLPLCADDVERVRFRGRKRAGGEPASLLVVLDQLVQRRRKLLDVPVGHEHAVCSVLDHLARARRAVEADDRK